MKRLSISLLLAVLSVILFSSCEKEEKHGDVCFKATTERYTSKDMGDKVTYDGSIFAWEQDDQIRVYRKRGTGTSSYWENGYYTASYLSSSNAGYAEFTFNNGTDVTSNYHTRNYYAIYPASIATDRVQISMPATQIINTEGKLVGFPMCSSSGSTNIDFKNLFGLLKLRLMKDGVQVYCIKITAQGFPLNGVYRIDYSTYNISTDHNSVYDENNQTIMLQMETPQDISNGKDFYIAMPPGDYTNLKITIYAGGYRCCTKKLLPEYTFNVQRSKYSTISLGENDLAFPTEGIVGSVFSINNQGGHVVFSKGNLQYQAASNPATHTVAGGGTAYGKWRFAEHQYDFIGSDNNNIAGDYSGWIDLFGWGTSGCGGKNPYMTSTTDAEYFSGSIANTNYDWGLYNAISNGGNAPGQWRVLTSAEMYYILNTRTTSYRFVKVIVNGVNGVILFPDNFEWPLSVSSPNGINNRELSYSNAASSYTEGDWQLLEGAGAVFLPQTGQRSSNVFTYDFRSPGFYWLSDYSSTQGASYLSITLQGLSAENTTTSRNYGFAVRLVHDVQ